MQRKDVAFVIGLVLLLEIIGAMLFPFFGRFLNFSAAPAANITVTAPGSTPTQP